jgi:hypothetical protein
VQADAKGPAYEQAWMRHHSTFPSSSGAVLLYSSLLDTPQPNSNTAQEQANHFKLAFTSKFPDANSFKDFNGAHVSDLVTILLNGCPVTKVSLTVFFSRISISVLAFNCCFIHECICELWLHHCELMWISSVDFVLCSSRRTSKVLLTLLMRRAIPDVQ